MAGRRTIEDTIRACPDAVPGADRLGAAARYRREEAARRIEAKYGNALEELARIAWEASDPTLKLKALAALTPYLFPALKAVELSGPDGGSLTVEVFKVAPSTPAATPSASVSV